jgi:hypothetical protein
MRAIEENTLNYFFGTAAVTRPTEWWLALEAVADPVGAPTVSVEVAGSGYARQRIYPIASASTPRFSAPADEAGGGAQVTNAQDVDFGRAAGGDWGNIGYVSIWTAAAAGTRLIRRAVTSVKLIEDGDRYTIVAGDLKIPVRQLPE